MPPTRGDSPTLDFFLKFRDTSWSRESVAPPETVPRIDLCKQGDVRGRPHKGLLPNFELFSKVWGCLVVTRIGGPPFKRYPQQRRCGNPCISKWCRNHYIRKWCRSPYMSTREATRHVWTLNNFPKLGSHFVRGSSWPPPCVHRPIHYTCSGGQPTRAATRHLWTLETFLKKGSNPSRGLSRRTPCVHKSIHGTFSRGRPTRAATKHLWTLDLFFHLHGLLPDTRPAGQMDFLREGYWKFITWGQLD